MRTRLAALLLLASALLTLGLVAGCGGGGGTLTLEEFFQRLEQIDDDFEERSADLDAEFDALSEEEALDQAPGLLAQQLDLIREFLEDIGALEAPDEAADLLDRALSAGGDVVDRLDALLADLGDPQSLDELFAIFDDEEINAAFERFDQVCLDAEQLAADNDITVDLNCGE
jgi:hypothetical protein